MESNEKVIDTHRHLDKFTDAGLIKSFLLHLRRYRQVGNHLDPIFNLQLDELLDVEAAALASRGFPSDEKLLRSYLRNEDAPGWSKEPEWFNKSALHKLISEGLFTHKRAQ